MRKFLFRKFKDLGNLVDQKIKIFGNYFVDTTIFPPPKDDADVHSKRHLLLC
jgi:hypothetical protein